jgi:lysyl-tRNA synthetase class 1
LNEERIIGKGTWLDRVAHTLIEREKQLGRSLNPIKVESGLGASGLPHIGSIGDAVRAFGITLALKNLGYAAELIAFSDDMDGLRAVPAGFPPWLKEYVGMPVYKIPDPEGVCHPSYGEHMSGLLLDALDQMSVKYKFQSAHDTYSNGILVKEIDTLLRNSRLLGRKISQMVSQTKYTENIPYFPICNMCGRLYVANAHEYLPDEGKVLYTCSGGTVGRRLVEGCGFNGEADIHKGEGKLAWKVEFAARWRALDIRFEAYGKDIMDSVRINDWAASEVLRFPHPMHVKYELFLDKGGKKISKTSGNVLTPPVWLKYGTPESLLLLLYKRITGTRHVTINDIPSLMDEYDLYEDLYFGKQKELNSAKLMKVKGVYEYINQLRPPAKPQMHVPYRLLVQQASLFPTDENRASKIFSRLLKYGIAKEMTRDLLEKMKLASNWADDQQASVMEKNNIELNEIHVSAIKQILETLASLVGKEQDPETPIKMQSQIFETARALDLEPKELFKLLYRMLIGADRGPKIGNYLVDLGLEKSSQIISRYLGR